MEEAERECQRLAGLSESQEQMIIEWQRAVLAIQRWDHLDAEEQQTLIGPLVKQVEVDRHGEVIALAWAPI